MQRLIGTASGGVVYYVLQRGEFSIYGRNRIVADGNWHTYKLSSTEAVIDSDTKSSGTISDCNRTFLLFAVVSTAGVVSCGKCCISACKIWDNGVLVRDFIPVRKGTVGYLYDRVSGKLFGNAGTGDFVLGPDVVQVEWMEFTGTQRLLTDIPANVYARDLKTSISYQLTSTAVRQLSGSNSAYFEFCSNSALVQSDASYPADLNRHTLDFIGWVTSSSSRVLYDGQNIAQDGFVNTTNTSNSFTFGSLRANSQSNPLKARVYSLLMEYQDGTKFLDWVPVRVGTDATSWEGAMIDTLTRRIYRNAGTGAFTYGNDLKYPIPAE
jgi:hypothetical protein